jgi:hypothetical protein
MIICLESSVLGGYLSNEVPGLITGLLHLAERSTPMRVELEGNFLQDIAGCRVDFHNPCPEADPLALQALTLVQNGHAGLMTGSYRVASLPRRRSAQRTLTPGLTVLQEPPGLKNLVFFEWFNEQEQRILMQSWHLQLQVSAPRWQLSREEENRLLRQNRARRRDYLLRDRRKSSKKSDAADPFSGNLMDLPPEADTSADPFTTKPKPKPRSKPSSGPSRSSSASSKSGSSHKPGSEPESSPLPDPFQRSEALGTELRRFERLLLFQNDIGSQPAVLKLLSTVADLAAHLGHALRQFVTSRREKWDYLIVDLEQSLPLFGAALSATERLAHQHDLTMDRNWIGLVQSCLLSIELRMRELLALLR